MVVVGTIMIENMQGDAGVLRKCLEEFANKFRIESADLRGAEGDVPDKERAAGEIDGSLCHRFIHRKIDRGVTSDAAAITERLGNRLPDRNAGIFDGMMIVDMQVTLGLDFHVDQRMPGKLVEHMVEEADTGRNLGFAGAVKIDGNGYRSFVRLSGNCARAACCSLGHLALHQEIRPFLIRRMEKYPEAALQKRRGICNRHRPTYIGLNGAGERPGVTARNRANRCFMTTIITIRKGGKVVMAGDGQVSLGQTVMKGNARKVRRIGKGEVIAGFAGATADAFTLLERLEKKLEQYPGQLMRAAVELAKDWRTDKYLRNLEAMMLVADKTVTLAITGNGDVLEPEHGAMAIGSGGNFALAASLALMDTDKSAEEVARRALDIAADICVYTNHNVVVETLDTE